MRNLILILFVCCLFSCQRDVDLNEYMVNDWETTYLKIKMPTHQSGRELKVFEDKFDLSISKISQSSYLADSTFKAWYVMPNGTTTNELNGSWHIADEKLHIEYTTNDKKIRNSYEVTPTKEGFSAVSISDWDQDGRRDDTLWMATKAIELK